jgi:hypothetical protein
MSVRTKGAIAGIALAALTGSLGPLPAASAASASAASAASASAASAASASAVGRCTTWAQAHGRNGARYVINADNWGGGNACLSVPGGPRFTVMSQRAPRRASVLAYPDISRGCSGGYCSPGSGMPVRLSALGDPVASWRTADNAPGEFDTALDLWFGPDPYSAPSAEIMIWLDSQHVPPFGAQRIRIDGADYELRAKTARGGSSSWRYLAFRRTAPVTGITGLKLAPFIRYAERRGLIRPSAGLWDVAAGFEIWSGGAGLATRSFSLNP